MQRSKIIWQRFKQAWANPSQARYGSTTNPNLKEIVAIDFGKGYASLYQKIQLMGLGLALALVMLPTVAFAQTGGDAVGKFKDAANKITQAIQQISGIAILLLLVGGFGLLMWGGISESFRIKAVRIITFSIIGAACLFLFAQPLADFLTSTFGANGAA